ncbi:MAG TPA: YCF48-related protein [Bryobacteraceae bacterium]|nr:YCF48-related protein [Bryobacteraceae bacterium]
MIFSFVRSLSGATAVLSVAAFAVAATIPTRPEAPKADWHISGPFGGSATAIAIDPAHPNIILAGARNSLLYKSDDAGATWRMLTLPPRTFGEVTSILVDAADSQHYLVGMISTFRPGIFESADGGDTWVENKDVHDLGVRALAASASDPKTFAAGTLSGVMLSKDSGKTWTRISDPANPEMQGITAVAIDPKDSNIIYAGTTHLPWRTLDGGKTWSSIHSGMIDDSDVFSIYIDPNTPKNVFASACSGIYCTFNRGAMWWKLMGIPNTSRRTHVVRQDPIDRNTLYAGTTLGLFKTTNHGASWKTLFSGQVNSIAFDPTQPKTMYFAIEDEGIGKSFDSGETIQLINQGFVSRTINSVTLAGNMLFAVDALDGETTGLFSSADRGETWQKLPPSRGLDGVHMHTIVGVPGEGRILLGATSRQLYKSIDAGATWRPEPIRLESVAHSRSVSAKGRTAAKSRPIPAVKTREMLASDITALYATKSGTKNLLFATTDLGLLRSGDLGEHWTLANLSGDTAVNALYLSAIPDGRLVLRANGSLYLSKDFGDHWSSLFFPQSTSHVRGVAVPWDRSQPLLVATDSGLFSSVDNGHSWLPVSGGLPPSTVNSVTYSPANGSYVYAIQFGQLYRSRDSGASWSRLPTGFPSLHVRQLWIPDKTSDRLYGMTNDLGILFRNEALIR